MAIRERNLDAQLRAMINGSSPGQGEIIHCVESGGALHDYLKYQRPSDNVQIGLQNAFNQAVTGRNDTIILSPDSHSLAASLTWNKNMTHLIGSYVGSREAIRNRIFMGTTFTPMVTVSGYGNTFANIYTGHGTATGDSVGWTITGNRNTFFRCNLAGPFNAAQAGNVGYVGVAVSGTETGFESCVIGADSIARDTSNSNLTQAYNTNTRLHDCDLLAMASDANVVFITVLNTAGQTRLHLNSTRFYCMSANWAISAAIAIAFSSTFPVGVFVDPGCCLYNIDQWCTAAADQYGVWTPTFGDLTDADDILRATRRSFTT